MLLQRRFRLVVGDRLQTVLPLVGVLADVAREGLVRHQVVNPVLTRC